MFGDDRKDEFITVYSLEACHPKSVWLFFQKGKGESSHSVINDMSRFVGSQRSKHECKKYVCDFSLNLHTTQKLLDKHKEYCSKHDAVRTTFPEKGKTLKFKNIQNKVECPITM